MVPNLDNLLKQALGNDSAEFRIGQKEAIEAVLKPPFRALVIQATGWGKSIVYFLSTKILRDTGRGPTLVVSPLLSLMRNQLAAAEKLGLNAKRFASDNTEDHEQIKTQLLNNEIDLLLISPERLANEAFRKLITQTSLANAGLIVIDEAHCISDWGHDFRPDYQRIGDLIKQLPGTTSVLATTATANNRVQADILKQLGTNLVVVRGSLNRESLAIQVISGLSKPERLAWLVDHICELPGSGIIYTLTTTEADRIAKWLDSNNIKVYSYHAGISESGISPVELRKSREQALLSNDVKALVATVALGMGFDKPDLGFVVHFQSPGNLVAYYQQIGRAGRAIPEAKAILFLGEEDGEIHDFFTRTALPEQDDINEILNYLESKGQASLQEIESGCNISYGKIIKTIKYLSNLNNSPVTKLNSKYQRSVNPYEYDESHRKALAESRENERKRFLEFANTKSCLMKVVRKELDDPEAKRCGKCSNCLGTALVSEEISDETLYKALVFAKRSEFFIQQKKQWVNGIFKKYNFNGKIHPELQCKQTLCLSKYGDSPVGAMVKTDKEKLQFRGELVKIAVDTLKRHGISNSLDVVVPVPSTRSGDLVPDFARRLANALSLPCVEAVEKILTTQPQKLQQNKFYCTRNLDGAFQIKTPVEGHILLVDDMVDSGWTFAVVGALLRKAYASSVTPLALCSTQGSDDD